jgi:CheY-like chemotaxis protein
MHTIVLVSPRVDRWQEFADALEASGRYATVSVRDGTEALALAGDSNPFAMVIDEALDDMAGIELIIQLIQLNAMIYVAMASSRSEERFHEETEGLGLLMQLSPLPTSAEAGRLVDNLHQLSGNP